MQPQSGFAFIASHLEVSAPLPYEVIPDHVIRRAAPGEIELIKQHLQSAVPPQSSQWVPYEGVVKEERYEGRARIEIEQIPPERWKYWVLAFDGNNHHVHEVEMIAQLLPVDFDLGFSVYFSGLNQSGVRIGWGLPSFHVIEKYTGFDQIHKNAQELKEADLRALSDDFQAFQALDPAQHFVGYALKNFVALKRVPKSNGLYVVGLFSIIESLITHAPRLTETLDSINHQVTNKCILMRKRYLRPVRSAERFGNVAEETLWKKLYTYRSRVAHGTSVEFDGDLQVLRNHESVIGFLADTVRELIRFALRDPEFLSDLRKC